MTPLELLDRSIQTARDSLRATMPLDRRRALLAVSNHLDHLPPFRPASSPLELALCSQRSDLGGQLALGLLLEPSETDSGLDAAPSSLPDWAARFLHQCRQVEMAMLLKLHLETGYMRLDRSRDGLLDAWIARKNLPARLRERADVEWLRASRTPAAQPVYQLDYPPETVIGGVTVGTFRAVVERLQNLSTTPLRDQPIRELDLASLLERDLGIVTETALDAMFPLTLTSDNAAWHAAHPGVALAPLTRTGPDEVILSRRGLEDEPFLFLARELRRQDASGYHDAAHHREQAFRADVHDLFTDRRFVHAPGRIILRRPDGNIRTDIDAAIFDRKTGTLALFELKSLAPFARSQGELDRQRDSVLYANRQISGVLDWINRYGADDIVNRIDRQTARTFRVQRVLPFVLCRHLARFDDGPRPDPRAAWASWPGVLRVIEREGARANRSNPLAALFQRLRSDAADPVLNGESAPVEIDLGGQWVRVYPAPENRA